MSQLLSDSAGGLGKAADRSPNALAPATFIGGGEEALAFRLALPWLLQPSEECSLSNLFFYCFLSLVWNGVFFCPFPLPRTGSPVLCPKNSVVLQQQSQVHCFSKHHDTVVV